MLEKKHRDISLDFLRGLALLLMVAAHFSRKVPCNSLFAKVFQFSAEAAPAFFFFALGITFDYFKGKDKAVRWEQSKMFLFVALAHNLYILKQLLATDFLWFIWFWQLFLVKIEEAFSNIKRFWPAIFAVFLALLLIIPFPLVSKLFIRIIPGPFPLLPWGMFILMGVIFSRSRQYYNRWFFISLALIIFSVIAFWAHRLTGWHNLKIVKWPISGTYLMLFCGLNIFTILVIQRLEKFYLNIPLIPRVILFLSQNLLLAVVLHYPAFKISCKILLKRKILDMLNTSGQYTVIVMAVGTLLSVIILLFLLRFILLFWGKFKNLALLVVLRKYYDVFGMMLIILLVWAPLFHKRLPPGLAFIPEAFTVIVMTYFALEMYEKKKISSG